MSEGNPKKRSLWAQALEGNDVGLEHRLTSVLSKFAIAEGAKEELCNSLWPDRIRIVSPCPIVVLGGPHAQLKRDLCEAIASEFGMNFLYVNCSDHPPLNIRKIYEDHQNSFVFIDNLEESDFSFQRLFRNVIEQGEGRLMRKTVPLNGAIFVMATEAFVDTLTSIEKVRDVFIERVIPERTMLSEEEKLRLAECVRQKSDLTDEAVEVFKYLWWEMMGNRSTVMDICDVIVVKSET